MPRAKAYANRLLVALTSAEYAGLGLLATRAGHANRSRVVRELIDSALSKAYARVWPVAGGSPSSPLPPASGDLAP